MPAHPLQSFVRGGWTVGVGETRPLLSAIDGSVVATVPVLVLFLWFERFLVGGLTAGSVKG